MRLFLYIIIVCFVFFSCSTKQEKNQNTIIKVQDLDLEIGNELKLFITNDTIIKIDTISLSCYKYFKSDYQNKLLWFNKTTLNTKGDSLYNLLLRSNYYGLIPYQYHVISIKNFLDSIIVNKNLINVTALIKADLLFSNAYYLMAAHLNKGRFYADSLLLQTNFSKLDTNWISILSQGYKSGKIRDAFDSLEPKFYNYQMLKKELKLILDNKNLYDNDSIPFTSLSNKDSIQQAVVKSLINQKLYDTLSVSNDSIKLAKALNNFQKKWFIQPDGKLGKYTVQAFSYNRQKVIKQICMAMERWRWENPFPKKYAFINIPAFEITVFESDSVALHSAVVCGKPDHQTPLLKSKIDHMLIYPYWNVPLSIATKEILPAVQRDTAYLRKKNFEVIGAKNTVLDYTNIPWKKYSKDYLPVRFRQRIGEENSLGIVKFNFHNPFGVYLHDTNSKRYFKTSSRAQSHGCIRLEKFSEFADFLIRDDSLHYTHDSLQLYFVKQEQRKLILKKPLPIYTRYYTAQADSTGFKLYIDVYKKDEEMMKLIYR